MKYKVSDTNLTSIADAIRTKGGTSASLSFPDGFVTAIGAIPTGGSSTLISKSVTANGTYDASDDSADGYSEVTVDVPIRLARGTFTPTNADKGSAISVTIPYTGNGYPVACLVYPSAGGYNADTDIYASTQKSALIMWMMSKAYTSLTPDYSADSDANKTLSCGVYKNSDTTATSISATVGKGTRTYNQSAASASANNAVRFSNATTMSVFVADTSYGFLAGTEYTYEIIYSS